MKIRVRSGFTIVELLVVVSIIALLIAILLPAIGKARDAARLTQSQGNLRNLSVANDTYAADWGDRQFTAVADDVGLVGDICTYGDEIGCMGSPLCGYDSSGGLWGYWVGGDLCTVNVQGCGYWQFSFNYFCVPQSRQFAYFGAFRLPCLKAFNGYVGDRWYDKVFWAPKDVIPYRIAEDFFDYPGEFTPYDPNDNVSQKIAYPSYVWSPAAMYHPSQFSRCGQWQEPGSTPASYKSPARGQCKFPDLKTCMIEHHWLQNNESEANPSFLPPDPSWVFSQGYNSSPACLFFDGHVAVKGVREAMDADKRCEALIDNNNVCSIDCGGDACEKGLWHRQGSAYFGHAGGYGEDRAYDNLVGTSMHMYTTDGIRGRDFLGSSG